MWRILTDGLSENTAGLLILLLLGVVSVCSWALVFAKVVVFSWIRIQNKKFAKRFQMLSHMTPEEANDYRQQLMNEALKSGSLLAGMYVAGWQEFGKAYHRLKDEPERIRECVVRAMEGAAGMQLRRLRRGMIFLSLSASTSPYVGLLGTVLGVIRAFTSIGLSGLVSLSVVAPGISEALVATAAGLFVAVPALVAYNIFQGILRGHLEEGRYFMLQVLNQLERGV